MNHILFISTLLLTTLFICRAQDFSRRTEHDHDEQHDYETPLFLTPYIENGKIPQGLSLAKNGPTNGTVSYSGFLTVNSSAFSNLFFLYFPAEDDKQGNAPFAIWLKSSSLLDAMAQIGPFKLNGHEIVKREYNWNKKMHVLFIDNPAGTGFSFTIGTDYATDQTQIGKNLLSAVTQFYQLFPGLMKRRLYVTGQSYGGKYATALAYAIHVYNQEASKKINLWGMAIGNGLIDPVNQLVHGPHQFNLGLVDEKGKKELEKLSSKIRKNIKAERWKEATAGFKELFWNYEGEPPNLLFNNTGFLSPYNILISNLSFTHELYRFVRKAEIRRYLNVGTLIFNDGRLSETYLSEDVMKSVLPWFKVILCNYNVLLYSGQLDIAVPYPATENFLKKMKWSGSSKYKKAPRIIWRLDGDIAWYSKTVYHKKNLHFTHAMVRSAGHMVPMDQPHAAFEIIRRFTTKVRPF